MIEVVWWSRFWVLGWWIVHHYTDMLMVVLSVLWLSLVGFLIQILLVVAHCWVFFVFRWIVLAVILQTAPWQLLWTARSCFVAWVILSIIKCTWGPCLGVFQVLNSSKLFFWTAAKTDSARLLFSSSSNLKFALHFKWKLQLLTILIFLSTSNWRTNPTQWGRLQWVWLIQFSIQTSRRRVSADPHKPRPGSDCFKTSTLQMNV